MPRRIRSTARRPADRAKNRLLAPWLLVGTPARHQAKGELVKNPLLTVIKNVVNTGVPFMVILVYIIGLPILRDMLAGAQGAWFSELSPANTRTSGASIGYQFSAAISGFIPLIAAATAAAWSWSGVAIVYMACGAIGLIPALLTRETWGNSERAAVDQLIAASK
ncbi:hypothetical protein [Arthrobacter humicola]|uniref:hypothetical protein n=1 Tax=Arthrobacter humicola TaxID=409291 RepID=UPI001FAD5344|nr:hypothetical protein [Arthrobacter humicola]MCI9871198.1 hypothetical protein [Arthrobacter humicola]